MHMVGSDKGVSRQMAIAGYKTGMLKVNSFRTMRPIWSAETKERKRECKARSPAPPQLMLRMSLRGRILLDQAGKQPW